MSVPSTIAGQLDFYFVHNGIWVDNAVAIGLTAPQATQMSVLYDAAVNARNLQLAALDAAKIATANMKVAMQNMLEYGSGMQAIIRGKAEASADPAVVYALAGLPVPAQRTPAGLPPTPTGLEGFINTEGAVELNWIGSTRYNTSFIIYRKVFGETKWTQIGVAVGKKYTDNTVIEGTKTASYRIVAIRSAGQSAASLPTSVVFGTELGLAA